METHTFTLFFLIKIHRGNRNIIFSTSNPLSLFLPSSLILKETTECSKQLLGCKPPAFLVLGSYIWPSTLFHAWQAQTCLRSNKFKLDSQEMPPGFSLFADNKERKGKLRTELSTPRTSTDFLMTCPRACSSRKPDLSTYLGPPEHNKDTEKCISKISAMKKILPKDITMIPTHAR